MITQEGLYRTVLDANFVTALWGAIALYGVLAALLVPRADQNYQTFLDKGTPGAYKRAKHWARVTLAVPLLSLVTVLIISLIAIRLKNGVSLSWPPTSNLWVIIISVATQLIFLVIIWVFLVRLPPYEIPERNASELGTLRSRDYLAESIIWFFNETSSSVELFWVDYDGVEHSYGPVDPTQKHNTYDTHVFVVRNLARDFVALFVARDVPGGAYIRDKV
jgi:hypothetical protein